VNNAVEYVGQHVVAPLDGEYVRMWAIGRICDHVEECVGAAFCSSRLTWRHSLDGLPRSWGVLAEPA
jgi:hypothetical protein